MLQDIAKNDSMKLQLVGTRGPSGHKLPSFRVLVPLRTLLYGKKGVQNGYSSTRVSLWGSQMFGAGTRVLTP